MKARDGMATATLKVLSKRWEQVVDHMHRPGHEAAVAWLFRATPKDLGEAAVRTASPTPRKELQP
jgi:hypothetical protein